MAKSPSFPRRRIVDLRIASEHFGKLKAQLEKSGNIIADAHLLIASVTMANSASLITGNLRHYRRIDGLRIEYRRLGTR